MNVSETQSESAILDTRSEPGTNAGAGTNVNSVSPLTLTDTREQRPREVERALSEHEAAAMLGLSVATLRLWRHRKKGPAFLRLGRAVRYRRADVEHFMCQCIVATSMSANGATSGRYVHVAV